LEAAAPVFDPARPWLKLVLTGAVLDERAIRLLRRRGVTMMWVRWAGLEFLDGLVNTKLTELRLNLYTQLKRDFKPNQAKAVSVTQYVRYCNLVDGLIIELLSSANNGLGAQTADLFDKQPGLFSHSANVAYLALTLGLRLETYIMHERRHAGANYTRDFTNLGIGAVFHDIGKLTLPSTQAIHEPLAEPPTHEYARHPQSGYEMIPERISALARAAVLHHHQRFDGAGFPNMQTITGKSHLKPLAGRDIHIFPRIVAVCDVFDHLCHDDDGGPRPAVAALHDLANGNLTGRFDPVILDGLLRYVPPFPIGSRVTLSDGRPAAIIALNSRQPCQPVVRLLRLTKRSQQNIDLAKRAGLHISEILGVNVDSCLYTLPSAELCQAR